MASWHEVSAEPQPAPVDQRVNWQRYALVFLVVASIFAAISGPRLLRPSSNNHFVHMASGWFEGRWTLEGDPPGYERRRHDDWSRLWTLHLQSGETLRAFPCQTYACADDQRSDGLTRWWVLPSAGGRPELRAIPRADLVRREVKWFVSFPPGPAVIMSPAVAAFGLQTPDTLITVFLAALAATLSLWMLDSTLGVPQRHVWLALAFSLGAPFAQLGTQGSVWFTAQVCAVLFSLLFLEAAVGGKRPAIAGLSLGMIVACRPHLVLLAGFAVHQLYRDRATWQRWTAFFAPLAAMLFALAAFNYARFGDPTEFGHRYLDMRWQVRLQEVGMFSAQYLWRNLQCLLFLLPKIDASTGQIRVSTHGVALWLSTPWLVVAFVSARRRPNALATALLLTSVALALPSLLYQNSGQVQFSYRFAMDWLAPLLLAIACLHADAREQQANPEAAQREVDGALLDAASNRPSMDGTTRAGALPVALRVSIVIAIVIHLGAATLFARAPARLFVVDPAGWPFEAELDDNAKR